MKCLMKFNLIVLEFGKFTDEAVKTKFIYIFTVKITCFEVSWYSWNILIIRIKNKLALNIVDSKDVIWLIMVILF